MRLLLIFSPSVPRGHRIRGALQVLALHVEKGFFPTTSIIQFEVVEGYDAIFRALTSAKQ
jgi:hypothetical protein